MLFCAGYRCCGGDFLASNAIVGVNKHKKSDFSIGSDEP
jgi:hypothetical protein